MNMKIVWKPRSGYSVKKYVKIILNSKSNRHSFSKVYDFRIWIDLWVDKIGASLMNSNILAVIEIIGGCIGTYA